LESVLPLALHKSVPTDGYQLLGWNLGDAARITSHSGSASNQAVAFVPGACGWQLLPIVENHMTLQTDRDLVSGVANSSVSPAEFPITFSGTIERPKEVDFFSAMAKSGKKYRVEAHSRSLGFPVDSSISVIGADGKELASNDDMAQNNYDAAVEFTVTADGPVQIRVRDITDAYSSSHVYVLHAREVTPRYSLTVDADHFTLAAGATVDIPVTVNREGGIAVNIEVTAINLPDGVTCPSVQSLSMGDTSKKVVLKLTATEQAGANAPIRIQASNVGADAKKGNPIEARAALREGFELAEFWLTVVPKKRR